MAIAYIVWNHDAEEGVVFADYGDAKYAATGRTSGMGVSSVADAWRDIYAEDGAKFEIKQIEI